MTTEHILYIPTIFFMGFLAGKLSTTAGNADEQILRPGGGPELPGKSFRGWLLVSSFFLFAIVFVTTHVFQLPASAKAVTQSLGGLEIFDRKASFSSADVYSRIESFPETGIQLYKRFTHTIDIVFPLTLLTFLLLLSRFVAQRYLNHRGLTRVLYALPLIWFGTDMLENGIVYYLLDEFPARHNFPANALGYVTLTKFSFLLLSVAGPAIATVFRSLSLRHTQARRD